LRLCEREMKLQTQIKLEKQNHNQIDYNSILLLLGSCFSENIGAKFNHFKFQSISNPFGILFHPKAIENLILRAIQQKKYKEKDIFYNNEKWHCFDAHSQLSSTSKKDLLVMLNNKLDLTNEQINNATHIIITLGTAWVYNLIETNKVVANCHKVSQNKFSKLLLTIIEIKESLSTIINTIQSVNPKASIIFTVSPVRHIKDGFMGNSISKSHLISAIHEITDNKTLYFPSYEIMLDELRDYRFYKSDMLHPSETAVAYIWQKFNQVWMASETLNTMDLVDQIQKGLKHKPFNKNSEAYQKFLKQLQFKKHTVSAKYQHIVFETIL